MAGPGPAGRIVAEAQAALVAVDAEGRSLEFRRPGALDRLRLFKALGPALSGNDRYVSYAMLAFCVTAIEGVPLPAPGTEAQLEALVARLGDAGLAAVGEGLASAARGNS
jgi:hypothetical protein